MLTLLKSIFKKSNMVMLSIRTASKPMYGTLYYMLSCAVEKESIQIGIGSVGLLITDIIWGKWVFQSIKLKDAVLFLLRYYAQKVPKTAEQ